MTDERKNVQTSPTRTYCKRSKPLPTRRPCTGSLPSTIAPPPVIQIVGRPGTGSLPSTIAPPDHPHPFDLSYLSVHYLYIPTGVF